MAHVRLEGVCKSYDGRTMAVDGLDLSCPQGQMLALLGPSGCGKSSTLKMIAGIEQVTRGSIRFDDREVQSLDPARRNVAMVFEDYALYPHLSVRGNIAFPLEIRGQRPAEIRRRVDDAIAMLGLGAMADQPVRSLSGGAQQRVSIGRALVREPALVMFDEPLSHLDADQKVTLRTEIRRLQASAGLTSVLVTHDQTEAMAMADRIAVMNQGVLQQVGSPTELYEDPANVFVARFIGEPPMNLIDAAVCDGGAGLRLLEGIGVTVTLPAARAQALRSRGVDGALRVGIRPEHLVQVALAEPAGIACRVLDRECAGDRTVLRVQVGDAVLRADLPGAVRLRAGEMVALAPSLDRLHVFDPDSGTNLVRAEAACSVA